MPSNYKPKNDLSESKEGAKVSLLVFSAGILNVRDKSQITNENWFFPIAGG